MLKFRGPKDGVDLKYRAQRRELSECDQFAITLFAEPQPNIHELEWDILLLLDACRADYFKRQNTIPGKTTLYQQAVTETASWLLNTFGDGFYDYIYVSGNPVCNSKMETFGFEGRKHIKTIIDVWDYGWDEDVSTVTPTRLVDEALDYINGDKRVVVHFMQPHTPFLHYREPIYAWKPDAAACHRPETEILLPPSQMRELYAKNLDAVLEEIERLIKSTERKVVITTDHGELLGECGIYFHPPQMDCPILTTIFWHEVKK